jgi:hypothetical protein
MLNGDWRTAAATLSVLQGVLRRHRNLGHWCKTHIIKSYLTGLTLPACLVRAGHLEDVFVLARGRILPPQHLLDQIYPGLQDSLKHWKVQIQVYLALLCTAVLLGVSVICCYHD